jgi:hypothetical protein
MSLKDKIELYERHAVLVRVAYQYSEQSVALWYALSQHGEEFQKAWDRWNHGELTTEQVTHLTSTGIDSDSIDE